MVNYKYKDLFMKSHVDKQLRIATDDGTFVATNEDIHFEDFELTESLCSESELRFGSCETSMVKFQIKNPFISLKNKWITISETLDKNTDTPFIFGRYKVFSDVPAADREYRDIVAYDAMYEILNSDVAEWYNSLKFPMNLNTFRNIFLMNFGINWTGKDGILVNDNMIVEKTIEPSEISGKDVITAICEINGCFGHIGRDGKFHYIYLEQDIQGLYPADFLFPNHVPEQWDYLPQAETGSLYPQDPKSTSIGKDSYIKCQYEDYVVRKINKLQIRQEENDIGCVYGEGDNCYIIEDNFLVYGKSSDELNIIAKNIYDKINRTIYRPFSAECVGNPCLEVGDSVRLTTKYEIVESYILERTMKGIQALRDNYNAKGTENYTSKINEVRKSIIQLKGKTNILERTVDETRLEMQDMGEQLSTQISVTAEQIRGELEDTKKGLENQITITAGEINANLQNTKEGLEASITATAESIQTEVLKKYETKTDAENEYKEIRSSIQQTAEGIRTEVSNIYQTKEGANESYQSLSSQISQTAEKIQMEVESNYETKSNANSNYSTLSSSYTQLAGKIVMKVDANGNLVQVALSSDPNTGSKFSVNANNIELSADDVMNLMSGGTLNLGAKNIKIESENFKVDEKGNVWCNSLSAVQFVGRAVDELNDAIWNSKTMQRVNEIIALFDSRMGNVESLLYNDKVLFDTLDDKGNYRWDYGTLQEGAVIVGSYITMVAQNSIKPYQIIDATGYNKIIARVNGYIYANPEGQIGNWSYIKMGVTNDPDAGMTLVHKHSGASGDVDDYGGIAQGVWYDAIFDISNYTDKTKVPLNVWVTNNLNDSGGGSRLYISKLALTNR